MPEIRTGGCERCVVNVLLQLLDESWFHYTMYYVHLHESQLIAHTMFQHEYIAWRYMMQEYTV